MKFNAFLIYKMTQIQEVEADSEEDAIRKAKKEFHLYSQEVDDQVEPLDDVWVEEID